jgi:hypothetical protein
MENSTAGEVCAAGVSRRLVAIQGGKVEVLRKAGSRESLYAERDRLRTDASHGTRFEVWALHWDQFYSNGTGNIGDDWRASLKAIPAPDEYGYNSLEDECLSV